MKDCLKQSFATKGALKRHNKNSNIDPDTDCTVKKSITASEDKRLHDCQAAHNRRHTALAQSVYQCRRCRRPCRSKAGSATHERACTVQAH